LHWYSRLSPQADYSGVTKNGRDDDYHPPHLCI
jgi:hypothetical protein